MAEPHIKGVSFIHLADFLRQEFGEAGFSSVAARLGPGAAKTLSSPFGHEWYPLTHIVEIERALAEVHYGGDYKQIERFGAYDGKRQVGTVYRFMLKLAEPAFLLKLSRKLWRSYMDCGEVAVDNTGPRSAIARISGYDPLHVVHCHDGVGSFRASLEVCGAKDPKVEHVECRLSGKPACVFRLAW
ncbi:MAG: hypothetical protein QM765_19220 [Myxococcales bacterium]